MTVQASAGELRFAFGKNWSRFLRTVNDVSIAEATTSVANTLGASDLAGKIFLDAGCGSGLFSLAARKLGARVRSFDHDLNSVGCTVALKDRYLAGDAAWTIEQGSVLDEEYMASLGQFDIAYSWGVLHHTGDMWHAITNVADRVRPNGHLVISIYNDQGHWSCFWLRIKRSYNLLPRFLRAPFVILMMLPRELRSALFSLLSLQPLRYGRSWTHYRQSRGMSKWHDLVDWVGGLPFEVAKPEDVIFFLEAKGFDLVGLATCAGDIGCNEYVFVRLPT